MQGRGFVPIMIDFGKLASRKAPSTTRTVVALATGRPSAEAAGSRGPAPAVQVDVLSPTETQSVQTREAERFVPHRTTTWLTTAKGKKLDGRIVNLSAAAVAIEANLSQLGSDTVTMVGSRPVSKGRPIALGMVFLFAKPIDRSLCNPNIIL